VYQSTETGRSEIWAQPFPGPGPRSQLSVKGGTVPRWHRNGTELFYIAADRQLMVMSMTTGGVRLQASAPRALFRLPTTYDSYEVAANGKQFLVNTVIAEASPITVILNWKPR
jgi:hypothetical protein